MTDSFAGVYLLDAPYAIDRIYDYAIPRDLRDVIHRGSFVTVPFGNGNRKNLALVAEIRESSPYPKHKPVLTVCAESMALDESKIGLALFLKEQTLCTVGDAVRAMLPVSALGQLREVYRPAAVSGECRAESEEDELVLCYLREKGEADTDRLRRKFGSTVAQSLQHLRQRGAVVRDARYVERDAANYIRCRMLNIEREDAYALAQGERVGEMSLRSEKQRAAVRMLAESEDAVPDKTLCERTGCTAAVLNTLTDKGYLKEYKLRNERDPYRDAKEGVSAPPIRLNEDQSKVFEALRALVDRAEPHGALLHGVTGSGKTAVMLSLISHLLETGKSAIVLLPEIALTPQSVAIFCARFGACVAVIHSALSAGERYDAYERIRRGEARVVVGTRSAVFAPVVRLGAIIIDEEQEHTYKSDMNPKYRAHDVARFRCAADGALMLLCSATPSLESYHKAVEGK